MSIDPSSLNSFVEVPNAPIFTGEAPVSQDPKEIEELDKKAVTKNVEIVNFCLNACREWFPARQRWLDMYHSYDVRLQQKASWQSKFADSFPFIAIESKASFFTEAIVGNGYQPLWIVQPEGGDEYSYKIADYNTKMLKHQLDNSIIKYELYSAFKDVGIHGNAFLETTWDYKELKLPPKKQRMIGLDSVTQKPVFTTYDAGPPVPKIVKDQPDTRTIYINDVWPDPRARRWEDCRFVCVRREISLHTLKQYEEFGRFRNVDKLKGTLMPPLPDSYYGANYHYLGQGRSRGDLWSSQATTVEKDNPIVEVIDIYFPQLGYVETIGNRVINLTPENGGYVFDHGMCPITLVKNMGMTDTLYGLSDFEPISRPWSTVNDITNMMVDNYLFHLRGYTQVDRTVGPFAIEQLKRVAPGSIITTNNLGGISHVRPDLFSPVVAQGRDQLRNDAYETMGQSDIMRGATPASNVRSGEQFQQLASYGAVRLSQSIRNITESIVNVGKQWLALNHQFTDVARKIPVVGAGGTEFIDITPDQIPPTANISVRLGMNVEANKSIVLQQMLQAINLAMNIPGFNSVRAVKEWFKQQNSFDDADRLFLLNEQESESLIRQQFGFGAPGEPAPGTPQGPGQSQELSGATAPPSPNQMAQSNFNAGTPNAPTV